MRWAVIKKCYIDNDKFHKATRAIIVLCLTRVLISNPPSLFLINLAMRATSSKSSGSNILISLDSTLNYSPAPPLRTSSLFFNQPLKTQSNSVHLPWAPIGTATPNAYPYHYHSSPSRICNPLVSSSPLPNNCALFFGHSILHIIILLERQVLPQQH